MTGPSLRERLERAEPPEGRAAQHRSWAVVHAAFAERIPRRRRRPLASAALALALIALVTAVALTPPGAAVADWVERVLGDPAPPARATIGPLPGGGRLLVTAGERVWIVEPDGTRRSIADDADAAWSPRGLYVATWSGATLNAIAPDGRLAWTQRGAGAVAAATWSPDGYRIAYRRGDALSVVAGDGSGTRVIDGAAADVPAAWRPGSPHLLSWVDARGDIVVRDPDSGRLVWRSPRSASFAQALTWSSDGRRVAALGGGRADVFDLASGRVSNLAGKGAAVRSVAWAPAGDRLALVVDAGTGDLRSVVEVRPDGMSPRRLFTASRLGEVVWSPAGRTLLVSWPHADQWLLLPTDARRRLSAVGDLARRFGGEPVLRGWCCTTRDE